MAELKAKRLRERDISLLLFATFLSGASALTYEVVWQRYLAILVGAQARATAITLATFLGGMSLGYYTFGLLCKSKRRNLFLWYGVVEMALGSWAIFFPLLFRAMRLVSPTLFSILGMESSFVDLIGAIFLIGFPTFLMGGTLPLLTHAMSHTVHDATRIHAQIYGWNTVGACVGCFITGYFLVPLTTLPIALSVAAFGNIAIALVSYFYFGKKFPHAGPLPAKERAFKAPVPWAILTVGTVSGFVTFTVQNVLIRIVGLSAGSSHYNFTLVVSIFVLSLGLGSLILGAVTFPIKRRHLSYSLLALLTALILMYISIPHWPYVSHVLRAILRDLPINFSVYHMLLGIFFLMILIVPVGIAGIILPLCFHEMKDSPERLGFRVGQLYALNSLGCVLGALLGGYYLLHWFNLDQILKICCGLVLVAGLASLWPLRRNPLVTATDRTRLLFGFCVMGAIAVGLLPFPKVHFLQPFRHPNPTPFSFQGTQAFADLLARISEIAFYKDGPNTTVTVGKNSVQGIEVSRTIFVNGKSDGNTAGDLFTTMMLGHIPALLIEKPERTCVIGFGTGMTIGALTLYPEIQNIDVVEISGTLLENKHLFDNYNLKVSQNPKVRYHEMDAFRYLAGRSEPLDLIVSEPSNPWVTGVENLYSQEFYETAAKKLSPRGIFAQWLQTYSFSDSLFRMVLRTMHTQFAHVNVFQLKSGDVAVLGSHQPLDDSRMIVALTKMRENPAVRASLVEAGIRSREAFFALHVIPSEAMIALTENAVIHRVESPRLSHEAAKAFFLMSSSRVNEFPRQFNRYFASLPHTMLSRLLQGKPIAPNQLERLRDTFCNNPISKTGFLCDEALIMSRLIGAPLAQSELEMANVSEREWQILDRMQKKRTGKFEISELEQIYDVLDVYKKYQSPIVNIPERLVHGRLDYCLETTSPSEELHGNCLLQKILNLEAVKPRSRELASSSRDYLEWFPNATPKMTNYGKLESARKLVSQMLQTLNESQAAPIPESSSPNRP